MVLQRKGKILNNLRKCLQVFSALYVGSNSVQNEERIEHLEKAAHGSMYDTASPQEREDTRRFQ
jgi:hypothetical protein